LQILRTFIFDNDIEKLLDCAHQNLKIIII